MTNKIVAFGSQPRLAAAAGATARQATSPQAVEATLSRISDEIMQDAIERRERAPAVQPARDRDTK